MLVHRHRSFTVLALVLLAALTLARAAGAGELEDALDNPVQIDGATPVVFTPSSTSDAGPWSAETATWHPGGPNASAAQSGLIGPSMYSSLATTVDGPASLSFYQKTSSQPAYDTLTFAIDGTVKSTISGTTQWQQKAFTLPAGSHTLRWKYTKNATINGGSDAAWLDTVVVSPNTAVRVLAPNGGEKLISGATATVTWNAPASAEKYDLYYTTNNGTTWTRFASDVTSTGLSDITHASWTWPVPAANRTACKVKVVAKNRAGAVVGSDVSDRVFAVNNVRLTAPNGGNVLEAGETFDLNWEATAGATGFALSYTTDNGVSWKPIATVGDVTTYPWTVPPPVGNKTACKVKIVAYNGGTAIGTDLSDTVFTLQVLKVTSPNGGESLDAKTTPTYPITFTVSGQTAASAVISYTTDNGTTWSVITKLTTTISPGDQTFGSWAVPAVAARKTACKVKVVLKNAAGAVLATDTSDANFTIQPLLTISGVATWKGAALPGVAMTLAGADGGTTTTDAAGRYSFRNLLAGSYTVTPVLGGYEFTPVSREVTLSGASAAGIGFTAAVPSPSTEITTLPAPPIMAFRQSVPSNDHTGPYDEIFPGQANVWILEPDFTVVDGFDLQFDYSGAVALAVESATSSVSFPVDQAYDELRFFTPVMGTAEGVKVAALSDGKTVLDSVPMPSSVKSVVTGSYAAFLNATSRSVLQQTLDLTSLAAGTTTYLKWQDAVYLFSTDLDAAPDPSVFPGYSVVLRDPVSGAVLQNLYGPVTQSGTNGAPNFNHSFNMKNFAGQRVVLSFEIDSSTLQTFKQTDDLGHPVPGESYAIVDEVALKDSLNNDLAGIVKNGGFEDGLFTAGTWTTNSPAEVQNVTSGSRMVNGLRVTRSFYTQPNRLWARWVDMFENTSLVSSVTRTITYTTTLGSGGWGVVYNPDGVESGGSVLTPRALTSWDSSVLSALSDGTRDLGMVFGTADEVFFRSEDGSGFYTGTTYGEPFIAVSYKLTVPPGGKAAIVNFALMDGTDTGSSASSWDPINDATARATEIDAESMNILNGFWTDSQYRRGMTEAQVRAVVNFPR